MITALRDQLLVLLKVPPEPTAPAGSHASVRVFRAGRNFYRLLLIKWVVKQVGVVIGVLFSLRLLGQWTADSNPEMVFWSTLRFWIQLGEWVGIAGLVAQMPFTFALLKFDYELRWYLVTDRSLRIRLGIWNLREMTMTFANIQQISVQQGPLQRLLGLADVMVRTAGGGSGSESEPHEQGAHDRMHVGFFHGVDNAGEIRDLIVQRMRNLRDTGLGDPDDLGEPVGVPSGIGDALEAARELKDEARALRTAVEPAMR
jgi:membrane protein YdbS with pleckstrin-like domain